MATDYSNTVTPMNLMAVLRNRNRGEQKGQVAAADEAKGVNVSLAQIFEPLGDPKKLMGDEARGLKGGAMMAGVGGFTATQALSKDGKVWQWRLPNLSVKPLPSFATIVHKYAPDVLQVVREHICTNGIQPWVCARLKDSMPNVTTNPMSTLMRPDDDPVQVAAWLQARLPLDPDRLGLFLGSMRVLTDLPIDAKPVDGQVTSLMEAMAGQEVASGSSMGFPYVRDYEDARFGRCAEGELVALERGSQLLHRVLHTPHAEFRAWLSNDMKNSPEMWAMLLKRKMAIYPRDTVKRKVRPYYVLPAHVNMVLRVFATPLRHVVQNIFENRRSFSVYRGSFFGAGASKLIDSLASAEAQWDPLDFKDCHCSMSGCAFSDDNVLRIEVSVGDEKAVFWVGLDLSAADMHYSKASALFEGALYRQHIPEDLLNAFNNFWLLNTTTLFGGIVLVGGGLCMVKQWGLNSGQAWTTPGGTACHAMYHRLWWSYVRSQFRAYVLSDAKVGLPTIVQVRTWIAEAPGHSPTKAVLKEVAVVREDQVAEGGTLFKLLGMNVIKDSNYPGGVTAVMPKEKLLHHLIQPTSNYSGRGVTPYLSRCVGLALSTGYYDDAVWHSIVDCYNLNVSHIADKPDDLRREEKGLLEDFEVRPMLEGYNDAVEACHGQLPSREQLRLLYTEGTEAFRKSRSTPGPQAEVLRDDANLGNAIEALLEEEPLVVALPPVALVKAEHANARTIDQDVKRAKEYRERLASYQARRERLVVRKGKHKQRVAEAAALGVDVEDLPEESDDDDGEPLDDEEFEKQLDLEERALAKIEAEIEAEHEQEDNGEGRAHDRKANAGISKYRAVRTADS